MKEKIKQTNFSLGLIVKTFFLVVMRQLCVRDLGLIANYSETVKLYQKKTISVLSNRKR